MVGLFAEVYSQFGLDWIAGTTMTSLIHRHCPELAAALPAGANAFAPGGDSVPAG